MKPKAQKKKETPTEQYLREILELLRAKNSQPIYPPYTPNYQPQNPNLHYHGGIPCYQNPCVWCGS